MITGKSPDREPLARIAVENFLEQTYAHSKLLIVNAGAFELKIGHPRVDEVMVGNYDAGRTLGALRNFGISMVDSDWIIQWDDDDIHHMHRILFQMAHRQENAAVALKKQLRVDIVKCAAYAVQHSQGLAGTLLFPKSVGFDYSEEGSVPEDHAFLMKWTGRKVVVDNTSDLWPGPALYMKLFHERNSADRETVMGGKGIPVQYENRWSINPDEREYIKAVTEKYYKLEIAW
jgi:glycosyltransferase involved in cell wall biosynthesis